jgi:hypothetical protein
LPKSPEKLKSGLARQWTKSKIMMFGAPLLLSQNMSGSLLSRSGMQSDSAQAYQECALQEVIDRWPGILPISDFYPSVENVCSLGREIPIPVADGAEGFIDNVLVTDDGHLVIVETKLWRNPEALREVIAQALQYSMGVSQLSSEAFEKCLKRGDARAKRLGTDETVFQRACSELPQRADDFEEALDRLRSNGDILLLIVGDGVRPSAERLVAWMNKTVGTAPFKLGLVELRFYDVPGAGRIVVPKSLLKISEASRHVVTINMQGAAREQVAVSVTVPSELPTTRKIAPPTTPMTEESLTAQIREKNPPEFAQLAETLRSQLRSAGIKAHGFPSCINYGIEVDGDFITLLSVSATNMWFPLPQRAVRALGDERFVACKQRINSVVAFYRPDDVGDPTKTNTLGPRFRALDGKVESFVEALTEVAETIRSAVAESS